MWHPVAKAPTYNLISSRTQNKVSESSRDEIVPIHLEPVSRGQTSRYWQTRPKADDATMASSPAEHVYLLWRITFSTNHRNADKTP